MNKKRKKLYVAVSIDVEEEGLFSGKYEAENPRVENVRNLPKLAPLWHEYKLPLTLFCAHSVFANAQARRTIAFMRDHLGCEVGGHLHHWSTPPILENMAPPARTDKMPRDMLIRKLDALLQAGEDFLGRPLASFRMGRWDLKSRLLPLLAERGIIVDSSVCPLRAFPSGPDHFLAPAHPYWLEMPAGRRILEAPITQIPVWRPLAALWRKFFRRKTAILDKFHFFGAMSANPAWHGGLINKMAARAALTQSGGILGIFWHSSEISPGHAPRVPDEKAAAAMLERIFSFFGWLHNRFDVRGITMSQLAGADFSFPTLGGEGDWQ